MRLWHYDLVELLPNSQLVALWRELNSIYKKQDKHILINYIYNYPKGYLLFYSTKVLSVLKERGFKVNLDNFDNFFVDTMAISKKYDEHNDTYLVICYYNLLEKYLRGQKDFTPQIYENIQKTVFK